MVGSAPDLRGSGDGLGNVDEDVTVEDGHRIDSDGDDGRRPGRARRSRRSNREPCSQHSMVSPSTSPSDRRRRRGSRRRRRRDTARRCAPGTPAPRRSRPAARRRLSSSSTSDASAARIRSLTCLELGVDGGEQPLLAPRATPICSTRRRRTPGRPVDGPRPRGCRGPADRRAARRRSDRSRWRARHPTISPVSISRLGTLVGAGAVGEHEVAVELVGVGAHRPWRGSARRRSRRYARQRPAAHPCRPRCCGSAAAPWSTKQPVLQVLAGVGEVDARAARRRRRDRRRAPSGRCRTMSPPSVTSMSLAASRRGRPQTVLAGDVDRVRRPSPGWRPA